MAQLPTIASTANRRLMPSAGLRVEGVSPAAFGAAVGAGLQQLGDAGADAGKAVQQFQLAKAEEENRLAEFDRRASHVAFSVDQATKLEEAKRDLSGPAQDFTKNFMATFDADAAAFLEKVPARERHEWQARMGQLRAGFAGDVLRAEFAQRGAYYKTALGDSLDKLQNGAMSSPDRLADWRAQGEELINTSGLSAQDKMERLSTWRANVALAAAQGDIDRDPRGAIGRLGGAMAAGAGGRADFTGIASFVVDDLEGGGTYVANDAGKGPTKWGINSAANPGVDIRNLTRDQAMEIYKKKYWAPLGLDNVAPGLALMAFDAAVNQGPERAKEWLKKSGGDIDKFAALRQSAYSATAKSPDKARFAGVWARRLEEVTAAAKAVPATGGAEEGGGVDSRYADLPASARAQMLGAARREVDRRQQAEVAAQQTAHDDWLNNFMNDLNDGKAGAADIDAARKFGVLTDFDEINRAQSILEQRDKKTAALKLYNSMLLVGGQFNPYDDNVKKAVDAAFTAQSQMPGASPLHVAMNIWQRTGVLPESGATMLRGGLVSTDANQVALAASVASNMLLRNPNAFAGVQGGSDIEQSAALYSHYANDLGFSAQDAAQRVAQRNAPDVKRHVDVNKPAIDAFRTKLRKGDVGGLLSNAFGSWFAIDPEFTAPEQKNVAAQDYADFAAEHYEQHGDEGAAQSYALQQVKKLYGTVNGRLMKFPPTRAYPPVMGSHEYIFQQAQQDIKAATGRDIPPDRIYLMPIPTKTAEAFRTGREVPYSVHYIDKVGGQDVYRTLPGQEFVASVPMAQSKAAAEFQGVRAENIDRAKAWEQKYPRRENESIDAYRARNPWKD